MQSPSSSLGSQNFSTKQKHRAPLDSMFFVAYFASSASIIDLRVEYGTAPDTS